jgi:hypothetical protein
MKINHLNAQINAMDLLSIQIDIIASATLSIGWRRHEEVGNHYRKYV